jgi:hypothetical protein
LVILGHIIEELGLVIEELGLGDASLGEDLLCMVFWLLMAMYHGARSPGTGIFADTMLVTLVQIEKITMRYMFNDVEN